ncbi:S46 family peptidase [Geothrix sp. 21YS21S-4]|uniref:S46 family peptidase n=1 Tax=Geothrix sp. 21YS21S-4 TaxID=3068889 RepID=UPI0027BB0F97|nr:S46 family peptidase [Geothrix sp. 21YS21S-4]
MRLTAVAPSLALLLALPALRADEGMWTFDNLPLAQLKAAHGFEPTREWLDHLRLASLRFPGGSGSFVSADGLVLTNHHVVRGLVQRLSTRERDLLKDGFVAADRGAELKVPGLELMQLVQAVDITARVAQAPGRTEAEVLRARELESQKAREELRVRTGLTVEIVSLYQGGQTWLYGYRKFTDVRLVVAPELAVARFGGDYDNFTYPRHHLDFALLRVYEQGRPYRPEHHLAWTRGGLKAGDSTFVSGHPGSTSRLWTLSQMRHARDAGTPRQIKTMERRRAALEAFAARGFEARALVGGQIYSLDNGLKATRGYLAGLKDAEGMAQVEAAERRLVAAVAADPRLKAEAGGSWERIEGALRESEALAPETQVVHARSSELLATALNLVRIPAEVAKPEKDRLPEFSDGGLQALRERLIKPRPVPFDAALEVHLLTDGLKEAQEVLGADHPFVKAMLGGATPEAAARKAVEGSRLQDPDEVRRLLDGGAPALAASGDAMIALARILDPFQRDLRTRTEARVEGPLRDHAARIARARFALYGTSTYPDATFTLRFSAGAVAAYPANGTLIQPFTTFHGLMDRFEGWGGTASGLDRDTWRLPARWLARRDTLTLTTPYNFVSTNDIIGGNSGSPVVDKRGELVGLAFDGNLESLPARYYYDGRANRTVSVDARAILEVLAKIYEAPRLVAELTGK